MRVDEFLVVYDVICLLTNARYGFLGQKRMLYTNPSRDVIVPSYIISTIKIKQNCRVLFCYVPLVRLHNKA